MRRTKIASLPPTASNFGCTQSRPLMRLAHLVLFLGLALPATAAPLTFEFVPPDAPEIRNPFARELWGEVITPSGRALHLPAYYAGDRVFAVRARRDEVGTYRLARVLETTRGQPPAEVDASPRTATELSNPSRARLPAIGVDPLEPTLFARADGKRFIPVGANLAWARGDTVPYYRDAFAAFARANLNWMRVWMAHWGSLNLDWLPEAGASPRPGGIAPSIAENWDRVLEFAEQHGVYVQLVLQHHGQFSTTVNPNWDENPWNAANPGGFLRSPADFFTDPNARLLTALKYRYVVARYGWSPAIFAWELFNEVHWVDALKIDHDEAAVARWHDDMADYLRSIDAYGHLVTTSTEDLRSPIYARMDFLQPHLYPADLVQAVRGFAPAPDAPAPPRPIFYGEYGDDHLAAPPEVKRAGTALVPPVWASVMANGLLPAQPWEGWQLLEQRRLHELGAVHRFLVLSGLAREKALEPFSPRVECAVRTPFAVPAVQVWQRRPEPEITLPADGREPLELSEFPATLVGAAGHRAEDFPSRALVHVDFPRETSAQVRVTEIAPEGGGLRFVLGKTVVAEKQWSAGERGVLEVRLPAGPQTLVIENPAEIGWVRIDGLRFPEIDQPVLAALGRRNDRVIAAWVRHRDNLFAVDPSRPVSGEIVFDDIPAGHWRVTWWDTLKGEPGDSKHVRHPGGTLRVTTPEILRHAAIVLVRAEGDSRDSGAAR